MQDKELAALKALAEELRALPGILREASEIIGAIPQGHEPNNMRFPIVDELAGFAGLVRENVLAVVEQQAARIAELTEQNDKVFARIAELERLSPPSPAVDLSGLPEGWEPVYLVWHEDHRGGSWVDDGLAEYEAAEECDRRIAYQPKQGS